MRGYVISIDQGIKWSGWFIGMTIFGLAYQLTMWSMPKGMKSANDMDHCKESQQKNFMFIQSTLDDINKFLYNISIIR